MDKTDYDELNRIQLKGIRILLNIPDNVANEIILSETGIKQIDLEIKKNRIIYEKDLTERFGNENLKTDMLETAHNIYTKWKDQIKKDKIEIGLAENDMNQTKECLKRCIKEKLNKIMKERVIAATAKKSTVKSYVEKMLNSKEEIACRKEYIDDLSRTQVRNIIIARAGRLQTKNNHTYKHDDKKCRWCNYFDETENHVLGKCRKNNLADTNFDGFFGMKDKDQWIRLAKIINSLNNIIKEKEDEAPKKKGQNQNSNRNSIKRKMSKVPKEKEPKEKNKKKNDEDEDNRFKDRKRERHKTTSI